MLLSPTYKRTLNQLPYIYETRDRRRDPRFSISFRIMSVAKAASGDP
jgi:hypothetical protein